MGCWGGLPSCRLSVWAVPKSGQRSTGRTRWSTASIASQSQLTSLHILTWHRRCIPRRTIRPGASRLTAPGDFAGRLGRARRSTVFKNRRSTSLIGRRFACRATGKCEATGRRSTRTSVYPFPVDVPKSRSSDNPVGMYRRTFDLPKDWSDKQVTLHFGGVSSAFYVWVNGQPVGYSQDSRLPAEFDITAILHPGKNRSRAGVSLVGWQLPRRSGPLATERDSPRRCLLARPRRHCQTSPSGPSPMRRSRTEPWTLQVAAGDSQNVDEANLKGWKCKGNCSTSTVSRSTEQPMSGREQDSRRAVPAAR